MVAILVAGFFEISSHIEKDKTLFLFLKENSSQVIIERNTL